MLSSITHESRHLIALLDQSDSPLPLDAKVMHINKLGTGVTFSNQRKEDCLRLKHIVHPHWDGNDYFEDTMLLLRYANEPDDLKHCLSLTELLSKKTTFVRKSTPHRLRHFRRPQLKTVTPYALPSSEQSDFR